MVAIPDVPFKLSAMCLGNSAFGTGLPEAQTDRLYTAFRQAGGNCFDSAHCYCFWLPGGLGASERALGQCIRRHGDSGKVCLITKGGHPACPPDYPRPDHYLAAEVLAADIADSLDRLQCDAIDLYILHRDDPRVPVGEIIDVLNGHIAAGHVRAIGASNWSVARISQANAYAAAQQLHGFVASQPQFNLAQPNAPIPTTDPAMRYLSAADIAWHRASGLPAICYSPTAGGYFAAAGQRGQGAYDNPTSRSRLQRATQLAQRLHVSVGQIALAYLRCQPFPVIPILGTTNLEHLHEDLAAGEITLSDQIVQWLENGGDMPEVSEH